MSVALACHVAGCVPESSQAYWMSVDMYMRTQLCTANQASGYGDWYCDVIRAEELANWFGFAAYADTAEDSRVRGLVDVAPLPAGPSGASVSLNVFWVLAIGAGSRAKGLAWDFLRHCASAPMDNGLDPLPYPILRLQSSSSPHPNQNEHSPRPV